MSSKRYCAFDKSRWLHHSSKLEPSINFHELRDHLCLGPLQTFFSSISTGCGIFFCIITEIVLLFLFCFVRRLKKEEKKKKRKMKSLHIFPRFFFSSFRFQTAGTSSPSEGKCVGERNAQRHCRSRVDDEDEDAILLSISFVMYISLAIYLIMIKRC